MEVTKGTNADQTFERTAFYIFSVYLLGDQMETDLTCHFLRTRLPLSFASLPGEEAKPLQIPCPLDCAPDSFDLLFGTGVS